MKMITMKMITAEQFADLLTSEGYEIVADSIRWHARKGRIGVKFGPVWMFDPSIDRERILPFLRNVCRR